MAPLPDRHLAGLYGARTGLAHFIQQSEREARALGTTHAQHHVLLGLYSHESDVGPTVKDIAAALGVASPSAVELVNRMAATGLLERHPDPDDRRITHLHLTDLGKELMHQLSEGHLPRLRELHVRNTELLHD